MCRPSFRNGGYTYRGRTLSMSGWESVRGVLGSISIRIEMRAWKAGASTVHKLEYGVDRGHTYAIAPHYARRELQCLRFPAA